MDENMDYVRVKSSRIGGRIFTPGTLKKYSLLTVVLLILGVTGLYFLVMQLLKNDVTVPNKPNTQSASKLEFSQFENDQAFKEYLSSRSDSFALQTFGVNLLSLDTAESLPVAAGNSMLRNRVSETNVQIEGLDEPDIVKTNGEEIFFSSSLFNIVRERTIQFDDTSSPVFDMQTRIINASLNSFSQVGQVPDTGDLFLSGDTLIVLTNGDVVAYNVENPSSPQKSWTFDIEENTILADTRLIGNDLFLVLQNFVNPRSACPLRVETNGLSIPCTDIWFPSFETGADTVYTLLKINSQTGQKELSSSYVASSSGSVFHFSPQNIYLTYMSMESYSDLMLKTYTEIASDLFPQTVRDRMIEIQTYDISEISKFQEIQTTVEQHFATLPEEEQNKIEEEIQTRIKNWQQQHARELQTTHIAKFDKNTLELKATGNIPGFVHNQFSLDEYQGNLRVATTSNFIWFDGESFNDVYVLNENLEKIGEILDLGITEQIYSTRFVGDRGYVVTFRRIDPFYVLDLSNPRDPKKSGELKIPGFSSYLHPLSESIIMGIGEEVQENTTDAFQGVAPDVSQIIIDPPLSPPNVKISLFDVSNPANPMEISKLLLNENWSIIGNDHHAFLHDSDHKVVFLPAGSNGYIISYDSNVLRQILQVTNINAQRAIYIGDSLYILGTEKIVVYDESSWQEIATLSL